ncbi:uncharacterized protein TNCV_3974141 [Trichonephila clavipes]|nr:uncharacterized protein TNCV_3974141 [Trichonephila clavipes]
MRSALRHTFSSCKRSADIHKKIVSVYGNILNRQNVTKLCRHFSDGRTDVHDEQRTGRPSVISDALLQRTEEAIRANRHLKLKELHQIILEVSMTTLYEFVSVNQFMSIRLSEENFVLANIRCLTSWTVSLKQEHWSVDDKLKHFKQALKCPYPVRNRRFVEWAQNEIAVVPDFHKRILFSDEAHFGLNGYVNKQNCRIWSEANPQVYVETPLHPEKLTVWCALWAGGILQKQ